MTRLSLIIPSIHRVVEVVRLFDSLILQTCQDFEVILVDQNEDERLVALVEQYKEKLAIQHVRVQSLGASRARNAGIAHANGEIILWPDDDSWLPPDLLEKVLAWADGHPELAGAIGVLIDETGCPHTRWTVKSPRAATLMDAFTRAAEPVLFFRKAVVEQLGGFDEAIGTGAQTPWGAGEGTDLCVRAMKAGYDLSIEPELTVCHARIEVQIGDEQQLKKARSYARGMGAVIQKNRLSAVFIVSYLFTYLRAMMWSMIRGKSNHSRYHWARITGMIEGLIESSNNFSFR